MRLRHPLHGLLIVAGLAAASVLVGCADGAASDQAGDSLIVTQVPAGAARAALVERLDVAARYPQGSRILWVRSTERPDERRPLSPGFFAAGAPSLSPDAERVLFAGRRQPDGNWAIYEVGIDRGRPSPVVDTGSDCVDPAYLAGDRLVFACRESSGGSVDWTSSWSLYTARRDGSDLDRITWGPGSAFDPSPLPDGRILFSMWQGAGSGRGTEGTIALFTTNPDGTLLEPFAGSHDPPWLKARARPTADAGVVFVTADRDLQSAHLERVEMGRPQTSRRKLEVGLHPLVSAEPADGDELLLTAASGVFRWTPAGAPPELLFDDPEWDEVEALLRRLGAIPKNLPSPLDRTRTTGTLVCYDARRSDGAVGPVAGAPRPVEIEVVARVGPGASQGHSPLARFAVESDASFQIEIPADRPLRLRTLDSAGSRISESEWFWVRPGEVRACFGCHESRQAAPVNRPVKALAAGPAAALTPGESKGDA